MAESELKSDDRRRNNIPVFTVIKNNAILKNIFLLLRHAPPEMRSLDDGDDVVVRSPIEESEPEEILTVGRHPNCSIVLSHPSISRFHLQIRSKPNAGKLSVTDLSSVHGTWVCGKRIKPRDCVDLNEGDELRLGGSSRVYKLHWVSACQAYDLDNPFCPSSDVFKCDDIEKHEEESLLQDETGLLADDDASLSLETETSFVSCEEVPLRRPFRNETLLKGILKHKKEFSPCMVKPLSFPLPDGEMMRVAKIGVEQQFNNAPVFSEIDYGREVECSQMVECDDLVSLNRNLSEVHEKAKQLCPLPESCPDDPKVKAEDCSQLLEVCINAEELPASQESPTVMTEKPSLLGEDQTKMPVDTTKGRFGTNDEESSLLDMGKGINQSVIASQTPKLDLTTGELYTTENGECFDAMLIGTCEYSDVENEAPNVISGEIYTTKKGEGIDKTLMGTCEYSYVENEAPKLDLSGELYPTENEEGFDAMLMDTCECSNVENEAPKSIPIDAEPTVYPESSDETQHFKFERVSMEFGSDQGSTNHESNVKPEDIIQLSEIQMVNSAVTLGPRDEYIAIESGNGALVSDSGLQIVEPLLDSFVFTENNTKESCGSMSMEFESESLSPKTPLGAKIILDNGNEKVSKTVSNKRSNVSKASSQGCQLLGALKILSSGSKVKKRGSNTNAKIQLRNSNEDEKPVSKTQIDHEEDKIKFCTPDKENCRSSAQPLKCMKKMGILNDVKFSSSKSYTSHSQNASCSRSRRATSKSLTGDLEDVEYEVEIYTPDKEKFTPNTRLLKSMKRMGLFDDNKMSSSVSEKAYSRKVPNSPFLVEQNYRSGSEKENYSLIFGQEVAWPNFQTETGNKKTSVSFQRKAERVPLQSLSINSSCRSKPDASVNKVAARSQGSVTRAQFQRKISPIKNKFELEAKVKWCMVADSTCFLDSKSRKALTLLQGLRGTKLIVPGTVLRELDAMKQQASFFRRTTEVSAALEWLEDCLVNAKRWIHIQSSFEETWHLLPTPPASPKLIDGTHHNGKKSWKTFSIFQSFSEVSSPKTEDHILEYALQQMRRIDDNQRIAILSNDTSLRIKAIAQGLICETATEFRDSLVNPFSERFLWSESSPRGRTWSCHDDIVLREHFYSHHSSNPAKGQDTFKGLQLIMAYGSRDYKTGSNLQWK